MINKVPKAELDNRISRFRELMDKENPAWQFAVIFSKINLYYFTGSMPDGMLIIPKDNQAVLWVKRSYERTLDESLFEKIKPMDSYRDAAAHYPILPDTVYLETDIVPLSMYNRFVKYFSFKNALPLDKQISKLRSIKSQYEINLMEKSGEIHKKVLEERVPLILKENISETELFSKIFEILMEEGYHGISRFGMFDTEMVLGQLGFGDSSIYPSYFNGPGGNRGICPAVPLIGSRERRLKKGDLVFVDIGCGYEGYHTDKTMTYMFGVPLPEYAIEKHKICVSIQNKIASMLKPGAIPADIYNNILNSLDAEFKEGFMGLGRQKVKFLGHGIGLQIDELPVIADRFSEPVCEGMFFAIEPKFGIKGIGTVGIENTFKVTKDGAVCITGDNPGLIKV